MAVVEQAVKDINFEQHRVILIRAYGLFTKALNRLASAIKIQDLSTTPSSTYISESYL